MIDNIWSTNENIKYIIEVGFYVNKQEIVINKFDPQNILAPDILKNLW